MGSAEAWQRRGMSTRLPAVSHRASHVTPAPQPCRNTVVIEHVFSSTAILSYILFWMIAYNLGHVF